MSASDNTISLISNTGFSPKFNWQVGLNTPSFNLSNLKFRATVRPLTEAEGYNRLPNEQVLYEETGILLDGTTNLGKWEFPLATNAAITGGPYRNYQVVIEAHDSQGHTSAGNTVGQTGETNWTAYPDGYDIIAIYNPRQTGIELPNNISTLDSGNGTYIKRTDVVYSGVNYMGSNGEIFVRYWTGNYNSALTNMVGGYLYVWSGAFPKYETRIRSGDYTNVVRSRFDFDPKLGYISHPTAAMPFRGRSSCYISVSFFDELDREAADNNINIGPSLYLSDNAIAYNDSSFGSLTLGGHQTIHAIQKVGTIDPTVDLGIDAAQVLKTFTKNGVTSIIYLGDPLINAGYTGIFSYSGGGAGGYGVLVNNRYGSESLGGSPGGGCFTENTYILLRDGSQKKITEIQTGDIVISCLNTNSFDNGHDYRRSVVTKLLPNTYVGYYNINNNLEVTYEHPIFSNTGDNWKFNQVKNLNTGDLVVCSGVIMSINTKEYIQQDINTYNFSVYPYSNYIAQGYLVHNAPPKDGFENS